MGGRLRWNPVSTLEAKLFSREETSSAVPQRPEFLGNLPPPGAVYTPEQPITQKLSRLIDDYSYKGAFESVISKVSRQGIPEIDRIDNLYQFLYYIDILVKWAPGLRVWEWRGSVYHERTDYLRIAQFYHYFNQAELKALQSPIDPAMGVRLTPLSLWLREFAIEWGAFLDTPESAEYLGSYKFGPEYSYQDYDGGSGGLGNYRTFNEWFSRTFTDIDRLRPVAQPNDPRVIAFPAESTYVGQWAITTPVGEPMPAPSSIVVKHVEWPIPELLRGSAYADDFEGGILVHSFLNVYDYHRQHAPAAGRILEAKFIPGQVYLDVELQRLDPGQRADEDAALANAVIPRRYLDAEDDTGYQFVQNRGLLVLDTAIGKVAVLPMGMAQVSSVLFVKPGTQDLIGLTPAEKRLPYGEQVDILNRRAHEELVGRTVAKGEMISTFLFGGSDIVLVFERKSNVNITATTGVHYPVRSQYAYSNIVELLNVE